MNPGRIRLSLLRIFLAGIIIYTIGIMYLMMSIYNDSLKTEDVVTDAAIVLGAAVWENSPSPVFNERINHAINLYKNEKVDYLIFTGDVGEEDDLAESKVAKAYAINNGIPESKIFIETFSKITFDNLRESKKIMDRAGMESVLIISDPIHMKRAMTMAKGLGMIVYSSPTPTSRYKSWETYFYVGYFFRRII